MTQSAPRGETQTWDAVEFPHYSSAELRDLTGEYYCDELESIYRVSLRDATLRVQFNYGHPRVYRPTEAAFIPVGERYFVPITFQRNAGKPAHGLTVEFDRSGQLQFHRRSADSVLP